MWLVNCYLQRNDCFVAAFRLRIPRVLKPAGHPKVTLGAPGRKKTPWKERYLCWLPPSGSSVTKTRLLCCLALVCFLLLPGDRGWDSTVWSHLKFFTFLGFFSQTLAAGPRVPGRQFPSPCSHLQNNVVHFSRVSGPLERPKCVHVKHKEDSLSWRWFFLGAEKYNPSEEKRILLISSSQWYADGGWNLWWRLSLLSFIYLMIHI